MVLARHYLMRRNFTVARAATDFKAADATAEVLLGDRTQRMIGTQSCLDVGQRKFEIASGQSSGIGGGGVALCNQHRGTDVARGVADLRTQCAQCGRQRDAGDGARIDVTDLGEMGERAFNHGPVLAAVHQHG